MASYGCGLGVHFNLSGDELACQMAEYAAYELGTNEVGYSFTVTTIFKGETVVLYDENGGNNTHDFSEDPEWSEVEKAFEIIKADEQVKRANIINTRREKAAQEAQAKLEAARQKQIAADKAEYERLKKIHG